MQTQKEKYRKYYNKVKEAAKLLGIPARRVYLGLPELICECPACERRRRIGRNNYRKKKNLPLDPVLKLPIIKSCSCASCVKRKKYQKNARGTK